eukprot:g1374.t1
MRSTILVGLVSCASAGLRAHRKSKRSLMPKSFQRLPRMIQRLSEAWPIRCSAQKKVRTDEPSSRARLTDGLKGDQPDHSYCGLISILCSFALLTMPKIRFAIRATSVICGLLDTKGYGLNVFQTTTTNNDFCGNMAITDSVGELVDICSAFCGNGNIPLLVGIPSYGFNHADIDTVCLADDNSLAQYNASHMND